VFKKYSKRSSNTCFKNSLTSDKNASLSSKNVLMGEKRFKPRSNKPYLRFSFSGSVMRLRRYLFISESFLEQDLHYSFSQWQANPLNIVYIRC